MRKIHPYFLNQGLTPTFGPRTLQIPNKLYKLRPRAAGNTVFFPCHIFNHKTGTLLQSIHETKINLNIQFIRKQFNQKKAPQFWRALFLY